MVISLNISKDGYKGSRLCKCDDSKLLILLAAVLESKGFEVQYRISDSDEKPVRIEMLFHADVIALRNPQGKTKLFKW